MRESQSGDEAGKMGCSSGRWAQSMRPSPGLRGGGEGLDAVVANDEEDTEERRTCCSDSGTATGRGTFFRDLEELRVILPFGAVFLSTSSRQFWGRWSRPASQLVRLSFSPDVCRCALLSFILFPFPFPLFFSFSLVWHFCVAKGV